MKPARLRPALLMTFLGSAKAFFPLSILAMAASLVLIVVPGLKLSIEFTGGTLMEFSLPPESAKDDMQKALGEFHGEGADLRSASVLTTKTKTVFVRTGTLGNEQHIALLGHLEKSIPGVKELQFTTIGPTVGSSLKRKSMIALAVATIAIILYVALAFRKVPRHLSPWSFGVAAVFALLHDILITVGIFVILSTVTTFQVDTLFITALLSIMGYSVNDTIVIFDRIRDNLFIGERRDSFNELAELSLRQTMTRTLNTGLGALIMLFALFFLGSESIRWFILTLIVGTLIGTYSSFFIATPLIVRWQRKR